MLVTPDARAAEQDGRTVARLVRAGLSRVLPEADLPAETALGYPGYHAAAHRAQRLTHRQTSGGQPDRQLAEELRGVDADARASAARAARRTGEARWPVDLPPAERHLLESLDRARAGLPPRPERAAELAALTVAPWNPRHRRAFDRAERLLGEVWPEMLAEVATVVRQVALLDGWGIAGFTDFTVHGVVFVNADRVLPEPADGALPAPLPLVEALVHEGTHTRCNAAAVTTPFLSGAPTDLLRTPLRADPRPLAGLFQQVVVLARSVLLYRRLLAAPPAALNGGRAAAEARHALLTAQGLAGCATLEDHREALTDAGRSTAAQARTLLERADHERADLERTRR
ncbi:aKG-HExxH-type peptide beta-hydroxylase [Kitasatospora viridis]|uniref:HEXXH motif-containing protein n=1 Tax=Kitasatospora viridis TaxID=281105 RepID=A0A561SDK8_9ACTN|nr:HEXXH motif-containing putative peptide modification protein [Kitasatospora viridis]TWF72915.1 HEXXH motif-containing protein [Kitasatospora viridis]